jgi:hypothetical protein
LYTCAIDIKTVLMDWNHQLPKLLYIMSYATFHMGYSRFTRKRGQRPHKKNSKLKHSIWKSYENLMRVESTMRATQ